MALDGPLMALDRPPRYATVATLNIGLSVAWIGHHGAVWDEAHHDGVVSPVTKPLATLLITRDEEVHHGGVPSFSFTDARVRRALLIHSSIASPPSHSQVLEADELFSACTSWVVSHTVLLLATVLQVTATSIATLSQLMGVQSCCPQSSCNLTAL